MFEATTTDGVPMVVRVQFWQCVKAGIGFTLGAGLLVPILVVFAGVIGASWATFLGLLSLHR